MIGTKHRAEDAGPLLAGGRGAFCGRRSGKVTDRGAHRRENVGISNDNGSENLPRRKSKGSYATFVDIGLAGP